MDFNSRLIFRYGSKTGLALGAVLGLGTAQETTAAAGRPPRQLSITKCLKMLHRYRGSTRMMRCGKKVNEEGKTCSIHQPKLSYAVASVI